MDGLNADFRSLFQLIESLDGGVRGREEPSAPPPEVEARLNAVLSEGALTPEERRSVFELLRKEPGWLAWFAEQIKRRRNSGTASE